MLERIFKLKKYNTNIRTEVLAGFTTFFAMAYIIFVNPNIMADAGMPKEAAFAATVYATVWASILMGLWANYPVAVAPGMGLNAFFAYYLCGTLQLPWYVALAVIFYSGVLFLMLTLGGIREAIIRAIPDNLKNAIVVGIGLFIAFIGFKNAGIVIPHPATFLTLGDMTQTEPLLATLGVILAAALMYRRVKGSILISIFIITGIGMLIGKVPLPTQVMSLNIPSIAPTFAALDLKGIWQYNVYTMLTIIFTFVIVELFDNMGTLIGLTKKAGLMKPDGEIDNLNKALNADAVATLTGAVLGTTPMNAYVENAAGVAEGGKTGLVAVTVGILFAISLVFAPLVGVVPAFATAPALILVGALMMTEVVNIDFVDITESVPAFLTIIIMPLSFSIADGFAFGFISYTLLKVLTGKAKEVNPILFVITFAFAVAFYLKAAA